MAEKSLPDSISIDNVTFVPLPTHSNFQNLTGQKFRFLRVVGLASTNPTTWWCVCECGNFKKVKSPYLKNGKVKSCGCIKTTDRGRIPITESTFWQQVHRLEGENACWLWPFIDPKTGYGYCYYDHKPWWAHRLSFYFSTGQRPKLWVLHSCDVRACVNPNHLREGTPKDNTADALARNRLFVGERHKLAKLKNADAREIRRLRAETDVSIVKLSKKFGVSTTVIQDILKGKIWRHV